MNKQILRSSESDKDYITEQLISFNMKFLDVERGSYVVPLNFHIKEGDIIVAGIMANLRANNTVFVSILWVDEVARGLDYGSTLLSYVEEEAKSLGATLVYLTTYDFQARGFYIKQGYEEFGCLKKIPDIRCAEFFMKKDLL